MRRNTAIKNRSLVCDCCTVASVSRSQFKPFPDNTLSSICSWKESLLLDIVKYPDMSRICPYLKILHSFMRSILITVQLNTHALLQSFVPVLQLLDHLLSPLDCILLGFVRLHLKRGQNRKIGES